MISIHQTSAICIECVMPLNKLSNPSEEKGICSQCLHYNQKQYLGETALNKLLNKSKGKFHYDCMIMTDGEIESLYSIYLIKIKYNLNPIVFLYDHGLFTDEAFSTIKKVTSKLQLDFIQFKTEALKLNMGKMLKTKSLCLQSESSLAAIDAALEFASRNEAPVLIFDDSSLRLSHSKDLNRILDVKRKNKVQWVCMQDYIPYNYSEILKTLKDQFNLFSQENMSAQNSYQCHVKLLSELKQSYQKGYSNDQEKLSLLIREKLIARDEAIKLIVQKISNEEVSLILSKFDTKPEDLNIL